MLLLFSASNKLLEEEKILKNIYQNIKFLFRCFILFSTHPNEKIGDLSNVFYDCESIFPTKTMKGLSKN
jgi:hypothetical protein